MTGLGRADEGRHRPGDDPWWTESFVFDAWLPDGTFGATASLTLLPNQRLAWYWAAVVGIGRPLVSLVDLEVPLPSRGLQIRAEGLWADHICEEPLVSWTVANEGFAVTLDEPDDALGAAHGVPTPMAFDLGFEAEGVIDAHDQGFAQPCEVHGDIAVGLERFVFDGLGVRRHRWGADRWWEHTTDGPRREGLRAPVPIVVGALRFDFERVLGPSGWAEWVTPLTGS